MIKFNLILIFVEIKLINCLIDQILQTYELDYVTYLTQR